jgi:hypothetical protein
MLIKHSIIKFQMPNHHKSYKTNESRDMSSRVRLMRLEYRKTLNIPAGQAFDKLQRFIKELQPPMTETEVPSANMLIVTDSKTGHIERFRLCSTCSEYKIFNSSPDWQVDCADCRDVKQIQKLCISTTPSESMQKNLSDTEEDTEFETTVSITFRKTNSWYV